MKFIENFKIFEYISNKKNVKFLYNRMLKEIKKIVDNLDYDYVDNRFQNLNIYRTSSEKRQKVEKILNKYQKIFLERNNIVMSFRHSPQYKTIIDNKGFLKTDKNIILHSYLIIVKDIYVGRVKTGRFLIHKSYIKNRKSIKENGLIPSDPKNYKDEGIYYDYPPAIFATESHFPNSFKGNDYWIIDTKKCNNMWYIDLNFPSKDRKGIYMTYEPIPPEALIHKGSFEKFAADELERKMKT